MTDTSTVPQGAAEHAPLVGTFRSIGPDGPTYEVLQIIDERRARILILESEREVEYDIKDILHDPGPDAAWKNR